MIKLDLHTHSIASHDGGIKIEQYARALEDGLLDFIAVTDHNTVSLAMELHKSLGDRIIVGEEISTRQGDLIGLFLDGPIAGGQSALATARAIKAQGGLVYVPHPFESIRKGLDEPTLNIIVNDVDIVEVHNGRALFQNRGPKAATWARVHGKMMAASSDAHGRKGLGATFTLVPEDPTLETMLDVLSRAHYITKRPPLRTLLYPKAQHLKHKLRRR